MWEYVEPFCRKDINVLQQVVSFLEEVSPFLRKAFVFLENQTVGAFFFIINIELGMQKLAPASIGAVFGIVESTADFCFEVWRKMHFFVQFMLPVRKWALILKFTLPKQFPVTTDLSFILNLVLSYEIFSLFFRIEMSFRFLYCCFLIFFLLLLIRNTL